MNPKIGPREQKFRNLADDAWYGPQIKKLRIRGMAQCLEFIRANESLPIGEWEMKVQRLFMDVADKPSNWTLINEILIVTGKVK